VWLVWSPGHSFRTYIINFQKHAQDTSFLTFLLHWLTVSRVRTANIVRRPCTDSSHATAPYKLSSYYYYYYYYLTSRTCFESGGCGFPIRKAVDDDDYDTAQQKSNDKGARNHQNQFQFRHTDIIIFPTVDRHCFRFSRHRQRRKRGSGGYVAFPFAVRTAAGGNGFDITGTLLLSLRQTGMIHYNNQCSNYRGPGGPGHLNSASDPVVFRQKGLEGAWYGPFFIFPILTVIGP